MYVYAFIYKYIYSSPNERWRAVGHERDHLVDKLVSAVQLDVGRHAVARGGELHPEVGGDDVSVRHESQHVTEGKKKELKEKKKKGQNKVKPRKEKARLFSKGEGKSSI